MSPMNYIYLAVILFTIVLGIAALFVKGFRVDLAGGRK